MLLVMETQSFLRSRNETYEKSISDISFTYQTVVVVAFRTLESIMSECFKDKPLYKTCEGKYRPEISALDIDPVSKFPFIL
jgi:hypothetical protein